MNPNNIAPHAPKMPEPNKDALASMPLPSPVAPSAPPTTPQAQSGNVTMSGVMSEPVSSSQVSEMGLTPSLAPTSSDEPVAVVKVLSVRGVEYAMMTLALWMSAVTFLWTIVNLIHGSPSFSRLAAPVSSLIVCLPVFAFFFLRLKKGELENPNFRLDPSKRRWSQLTQLFAFLVCIANLIFFIYTIMQIIGGESKASLVKASLDLLTILIVAGGILVYYWFDERRIQKG